VANSVRDQMATAAAAGATAAGGAASAAGSAAQGATSLPQAVLFHGLTVGFSTGLVIAGCVAFSGFFVALLATRTPGRWRLSSARYDVTPPCDEVLGTCLAEVALEPHA
jgi:hypothetical protein